MHEKQKLIERGLVAAAISLQILADVLPLVVPYVVVLAVIWIAARLVIYHTRRW